MQKETLHSYSIRQVFSRILSHTHFETSCPRKYRYFMLFCVFIIGIGLLSGNVSRLKIARTFVAAIFVSVASKKHDSTMLYLVSQGRDKARFFAEAVVFSFKMATLYVLMFKIPKTRVALAPRFVGISVGTRRVR